MHLWGRARVWAPGAGSAWNPTQKLQLLNSNRSSHSWWSTSLFPKRQCSERAGNGVLAASDTSGVCSPSLLCQAQEQPYDASKVNRRTVSTSSHLEMSCVQLPLRTASHYCPLRLFLFPKQFSISVLRVWGLVFLIFTAKNCNPTCVEKSKMQKKRKNINVTNSYLFLQLRHFGGRKREICWKRSEKSFTGHVLLRTNKT